MKTVIEMAREAGIYEVNIYEVGSFEQSLERFAELVRADAIADEREACAKVCEENATDLSEGDWDSACINCADHIRARSNA